MFNPIEDDFGIPDEYLLELGKIIVSFGKLESLLNETLAWAMIDDIAAYPRALAAFAHMNFTMRMDALEAMLFLIEKEFAELYRDKVYQHLKDAQAGRNSAVHQLWSTSQGEITRSDVKAKRKLKLTTTSVSLQDLKDVLQTVENAYSSLSVAINFPLTLKFNPHEGQ
jgi:hypothetical protein